jgi:hypothetical protein
VSVLLVVAAVVTVAGALVAITGRDARVALAGLVVALAAAPLLADPLPGPASIGVRVVAALLGGYLLYMILRDTTTITRGSLVGLPAETLAAAAAFVIGYGTSGLGSTPLGPAEASAAGFALAVIAAAPIVRGADVFRLGVALAILITGAELIRVGLAGTPTPLEQLMTAGLTLGMLGTIAVLCASAVAATGGLALRSEPRRSALFEAHPVAPTAPSSFRPTWRPRRPSRPRRPGRAGDAHRIVADGRDGGIAQGELWPTDERDRAGGETVTGTDAERSRAAAPEPTAEADEEEPTGGPERPGAEVPHEPADASSPDGSVPTGSTGDEP